MTPFQFNFRVSLFVGLLVLSTVYFILGWQLKNSAINWFGFAMLPEAIYHGVVLPHLNSWEFRIEQSRYSDTRKESEFDMLKWVNSFLRTSLRIVGLGFVIIGIVEIT